MIVILLSTYNGEAYLKEQLDSLYSQTYKNIQVIVRDDGSSDKTLDILNSYDVVLLQSTKNVGVKKSFSMLLEYAIHETNANYFMFCDQDDVWEKDKIENTSIKMKELEIKYPNKPLLVHTDLKVVDENLNILNHSFWKYEKLKPTENNFNRLLIQNTITGCTVMINQRLAQLSVPIPSESILHDYWIGLVASYFGKIGILEKQTILYRQHDKNSVGSAGFGLKYFQKRLKQKDVVSANIPQAKAFLDIYRDILDEGTIEILEEFSTLESQSFWQKRKTLLKHKLLKQGFLRNLGLLLKI